MGVLEAIEQRVRDSFGRQLFMGTIGATLDSVRDGEVEIVLPFSPALTQQHGFVHAGAVTTIVDTACGYACAAHLPDGAENFTTVELKINYVRPVSNGRVLARARMLRMGATLSAISSSSVEPIACGVA